MGGLANFIKNSLIYKLKAESSSGGNTLDSGGFITVSYAGFSSLLIDAIEETTYTIGATSYTYPHTTNIPIPSNIVDGKIALIETAGVADLYIGEGAGLPTDYVLLASFSTDATTVTNYEYTAKESAGFTRERKIQITGTILAGTIINANVAGVNYTISGDDVLFPYFETAFNTTESIMFFLNGINQYKSTDVLYVNNISFSSSIDLEAGDEFSIIF